MVVFGGGGGQYGGVALVVRIGVCVCASLSSHSLTDWHARFAVAPPPQLN